MQLDGETLRFIFGFKLRGLRQERDLSLKALAKKTGLSPSYINEIEKGKKYPKSDKIRLLSQTLNVSYDDLTSIKLKNELGLLAQTLGNNMVRNLPFDVFGIPARTLFELMSERPQSFGALIGTVLELARKNNITVEDFFRATLSAYLDSNGNYFPELERLATEFLSALPKEGGAIKSSQLIQYLTSTRRYRIKKIDFKAVDPALKDLYFHFIPGNEPSLSLNPGLSENETLFILAKEIGYCLLGQTDRMNSSFHLNPDSFDALLNNFKSAYFASALVIPEKKLVEQMSTFFKKKKWDPNDLLDMVSMYSAPPAAFFHRVSQILPSRLGLDQVFFLRFEFNPKLDELQLLQELHLSGLHAPHEAKNQEHYCRRWLTTSLMRELNQSNVEMLAGAQRSEFFGTGKEYLCFSLAHKKELDPTRTQCLTVGLRVNDDLRKRVAVLEDQTLLRRMVSDICESCGIQNCAERAAEPKILNEEAKQTLREKALDKLQGHLPS